MRRPAPSSPIHPWQQKMILKLLVEGSENRVVFADCDGNFVNIILSFLTMPLASIIRLSGKQPFGSLHKLYESIEKLDISLMRTSACKNMLLRPISSAATSCSALPINIDNVDPFELYCCTPCKKMSLYSGATCPECHSLMLQRAQLKRTAVDNDGVFVYASVRFILTDDFVVSEASTEAAKAALRKFGISGAGCRLEEMEVNVTREVILKLLKRCLVSNTPLTDVFLAKKDEEVAMPKQIMRTVKREAVQKQETVTKKIKIKLVASESSGRLIHAEGSEDFVDLLFSFLTYPIGSLVKYFGAQSSLCCFDNLYSSIQSLSTSNCFRNQVSMMMLLNPKLPAYAGLPNRLIIPTDELSLPSYYMCCKRLYDLREFFCSSCKVCNKNLNQTFTVVRPTAPAHSCTRGTFVKGSTYMISDDLQVNPLTWVSVALDLGNEAADNLMVIHTEIGPKETFALLRASITSNTVLTDTLQYK